MGWLLTIWFLFYSVLISLIFYPVALLIWAVTFPFDRRKLLLHQFTCFWGASHTWIMPGWKIRVIDRKKFERGKTYVVVSNHQSQVDIILAFNLFRHFKWVSKAEIFKLPLIGWNMYLNRYVRLIRGDKESIEQMMRDSEERLLEGSSVYFFPEGTRSKDTNVKAFKPGAFILAHKLKLPILMIATEGTGKTLPKNSIEYKGSQELFLKVIGEMPYEEFSDLTVEETAEKVRNIIAENVYALRTDLQN